MYAVGRLSRDERRPRTSGNIRRRAGGYATKYWYLGLRTQTKMSVPSRVNKRREEYVYEDPGCQLAVIGLEPSGELRLQTFVIVMPGHPYPEDASFFLTTGNWSSNLPP